MRRNNRTASYAYSLFPVLRGEGRGEGRATRGVITRGHVQRLPCTTAIRLHAHLAPLPRPLPGVPGRGSLLLVLVALIPLITFTTVRAQQKPNIITIITDDQAPWALGC